MSTKTNNEMKIIIDPQAMLKIRYWVDACDSEVSGMGTVERVGNTLYISDAFLLKQEVTGVTTEIDALAMGQLEYQLHKDEVEDTLNFWWHSHVDMGVFWSGTDHEQLTEFADAGWIAAAVFNKQGQVRGAYQQGQGDYYPAAFLDNIEVTSEYMITDVEKEELDKEIEEKVTVKKFKVKPTNWPAMNNHRVHEVAYSGKRGANNYISPIHHDGVNGLTGSEQIAVEEWRGLADSFFGSNTDEEVLEFYEQYKDDTAMIRMKDDLNATDTLENNYERF